MTSPRLLWWLLVIVAGGYFTSFVFFPAMFLVVGTNHYGVWFLDSFAILAANDALARGLDPYVPNALDYFHRPHVYSHWWLHLRDLGLTRADNVRVGFVIVAVFFVCAVARLRPRQPGELMWYLIILCGSPILLAIDRANNDLIVFVLLAPVVPCLLSSRRWLRFLPAVLIAAATGLKFYPAIAGLILLADAPPRELRWRVLVAALLLAAVAVNVAPDFARIKVYMPKADGLMTFGASNVFEAAGLALRAAQLTGLAVGVLVVAVFLGADQFLSWRIRPEDRAAWWSFVLGASMLAGCFFAATNYAYRWVFAVWLAPLLWRLPRDVRAPPAIRRLARLTRVLLVIALWIDPFATLVLTRLTGRVSAEAIMTAADRVFAIEQPIVWAFFICLLAFLAHFARRGIQAFAGHPAIDPVAD